MNQISPRKYKQNIFKLRWKPKITLEKDKDSFGKYFYWKKAPLWTKNKIKVATKNWFKYLK